MDARTVGNRAVGMARARRGAEEHVNGLPVALLEVELVEVAAV